MTIEQLNTLVADLEANGYKRYSAPNSGEYAYFKSFGKSEMEDERSNYQICFEVYDWRKYPKVVCGVDDVISTEFQLLISRHISERLDIIQLDIKDRVEAEKFSAFMFQSILDYENSKL